MPQVSRNQTPRWALPRRLLGLRWDFASNIAFKADYTRFSSDTDVRFTSRDGAGLISAGLVFTF
jgi:hypothetical protein